jgi:multiple sugar transport system ATP-binding protein
MTVRGNLSFGLQVGRHAQAEIEKARRRRRDAADRPLLDRKPASSPAASASAWRSAGRWCATPQVFLFDEPLSNLDAKLRADMRVEIKRLHQRS